MDKRDYIRRQLRVCMDLIMADLLTSDYKPDDRTLEYARENVVDVIDRLVKQAERKSQHCF